jgi:hypothetical protein
VDGKEKSMHEEEEDEEEARCDDEDGEEESDGDREGEGESDVEADMDINDEDEDNEEEDEDEVEEDEDDDSITEGEECGSTRRTEAVEVEGAGGAIFKKDNRDEDDASREMSCFFLDLAADFVEDEVLVFRFADLICVVLSEDFDELGLLWDTQEVDEEEEEEEDETNEEEEKEVAEDDDEEDKEDEEVRAVDLQTVLCV